MEGNFELDVSSDEEVPGPAGMAGAAPAGMAGAVGDLGVSDGEEDRKRNRGH